jgi:hypothetical protein
LAQDHALKAWGATLFHRLQQTGFESLLQSSRNFASPNVGSNFEKLQGHVDGAPFRERFSIVGFYHASDGTRQWTRANTTTIGRVCTARVAQEILVQNAVIQTVAIQCEPGATIVNGRAEEYIIPAYQIDGTKPGQIYAALRKGMPFDFGDVLRMRAVSESCTALIGSIWGDEHSSNGVIGRHCRYLVDQLPPNILIDEQELCLQHRNSRIKVTSLEGHSIVSLSYSLARMTRNGNVANFAPKKIQDRVARGFTCIDFVPPPAADVASTARAVDLIHKLDAPYHNRLHVRKDGTSTTRKSLLSRDLAAIMAMDNSKLTEPHITHYCWLPPVRTASGLVRRKCCNSPEEALAKTQAAYTNLFCARMLPGGSIAKWTHLGILLQLLVTGFLFRDIYVPRPNFAYIMGVSSCIA